MRAAIPATLAAALFVWSSLNAMAQATWQPTQTPAVSAETEAWYQAGEPIAWSDDAFYQTGTVVHFNQYQMSRAGSYRGIPLYTDAVNDPFGTIYVPLSNGLMRAYERRRGGPLAGTTGNRAPSFPTVTAAEGYAETPVAAIGTVSAAQPEPEIVPMTGRSIVEAPRGAPESVQRPKGINAVWITYQGIPWFAAGKAVPLDREFRQTGSYYGFPVYRRANDDTEVFVTTAPGMVAPFSRTRQKLPIRNEQ